MFDGRHLPGSRSFGPLPSALCSGALLFLASVGGIDCGGRIEVEPAPPGERGSPSGATDHDGQTRPVTVTDIDSASFVGDSLYLRAKLDGRDTFAVLRARGGIATVLRELPEFANGSAHVERIDERTHVRLRAAPTETWLDVLDTREVEYPRLQVAKKTLGTVDEGWRDTFSVDNGDVLLCLRPESSYPSRLARVALHEDMAGGMALFTSLWPDGEGQPSRPCGGAYVRESQPAEPSGGFGLARGPLWVSWGAAADLDIWRAGPATVSHLGDYSYDPSGAHAYGAVRFAATDGERVVFDPSSNSDFFIWSNDAARASITHAVFAGAGPKRLIAVIHRRAYVATRTAIQSYDVSNVDAPRLDAWNVSAGFGDLPRPLAHDDARILLASAGRLFVVSLAAATVESLTVVATL